MDDLDQNILSELARDARSPVATLAKKLGLARSTVQTRIDKLEQSRVIAGYTIRLGEGVKTPQIRATALLQVEPRAQPTVLSRLRPLPQVSKAYTASGRFDVILEISTDTTADLDSVLDQIGDVPGVRASESLIHLSTRIDRART